MINREPKRLRIDILNDILNKARASKKQLKSGKITRHDSDVSLSESLYDSLFSEDDSKTDDSNRSKNKSRNKSLDVSDVVTACLDNMAAKTGNIKIQKQSHMDRWLQKAKSKTPEKVKTKVEQDPPKMPVVTTNKEATVTPIDKAVNPKVDKVITPKDIKIIFPKVEKVIPKVEKLVSNNKKKKLPPKEVKITKVYSLRRSYESQNALIKQSENDELKLDDERERKSYSENKSFAIDESKKVNLVSENMDFTDCNGIIPKNTPIADSNKEISSDDSSKDSLKAKIELLKGNTKIDENNDEVLDAINELLEDTSMADSIALSKPCITNEDSDKETEKENCITTGTKSGNLDIKPEVMDLDECQKTNVLNGDQPTAITENLISSGLVKIDYESPVKTVKDLTITVINGDSPVKLEKESYTETRPAADPDLEAKQDDIEIINQTSNVHLDGTTHETSPTCNEMVSITESSSFTVGENSSITSLLKGIVCEPINLQDHNSNLTNVSGKKNVIVDLTEKKMEESIANINSTENYILIESDISMKKPDTPIKKSDVSKAKKNSSCDEITDEDIIMSEKYILNQSGNSESILQIANDLSGVVSENPKVNEDSESISLNSSTISESILDTSTNEAPINSLEIKSYENISSSNSNGSKPFLDDSHNVDCLDSATVNMDYFFREVNLIKPPDLTSDNVATKDLLLDVQNNDINYEEDSDDEPSPEYEPLGEEITEDFRQHMKCIESCITDKKDEEQLVKVCNEIAILEESKTKLADIRSSISITSPNKSMLNDSLITLMDETRKKIKEENIKAESCRREYDKIGSDQSYKVINHSTAKEYIDEPRNGEVKRKSSLNEKTIKIDLTKATDRDITKREDKAEILGGLSMKKKSLENRLQSPPAKKKHNLSRNKNKSRIENIGRDFDTNESLVVNDSTVNPLYKTIDQIEEIMKSKPKRLPIENGEIRIPEITGINYHTKKEIDTPDLNDDDFDIENVSVSSEDSEVSLPQNNVPARRSLRSRPDKKGGLEDPDFLTYMELRQDDLMEEHPELSRDDIVLYLYKTYTYAQNLKSDVKLEESTIVMSIKQEAPTPSRKKSNKPQVQPKNTIENLFRVKYKNAKKIYFEERSESAATSDGTEDIKPKRETRSTSPVDSGIENSKDSNENNTPDAKRKTKSKSPTMDLTQEITKDVKFELINYVVKQEDTSSPKTSTRLRKNTISPRVLESVDLKMYAKVFEKSLDKRVPVVVISPMKEGHNTLTKHKQDTKIKHEQDSETNHEQYTETKHEQDTEIKHERDTEMKYEQDTETKHERDTETESMDSDSELPLRQLRSKFLQNKKTNDLKKEISELKDTVEDTASVSSDNEPLLKLKPKKVDKSIEGSYEDPEFLKYLQLKQDAIIDENPQLSNNEIKAYLYKTWIYENNSKSDIKKSEDTESSNLVKGLSQESVVPQRKLKRKHKTEKNMNEDAFVPKEKPKRKTVSHYYNEAFLSDIEDELEVFEIFKTKKSPVTIVSKQDSPKKEIVIDTKTEEALKNDVGEICEEINTLDEIELYFKQLTSPKPSVFKGLIREKVCEICEDISNLIKCKSCNGTFHYDCVNNVVKTIETPTTLKGRRKKNKTNCRKPKNLEDSENSDERSHEVSEENISMEEIAERIVIDAATLESPLEAKMKELLDKTEINYDSYSSDDGIDWAETVVGKCEIIDVKLKPRRPPIDYSNFKCNNCQKYDTPVCFVCKSAVSKTDVKIRQKCNVAQCYNYYHLECLDHWPQTQFNAGGWTRNNKKASEPFEALTCPRHVCHTCVSDDPRGCKTRFSGDKLAKCVRCPATYHSFNKCLPAGTQILTASLIICPRHYEHR